MQATMPKEAGDSDLMESDDSPSGLDDDDKELDASLNSSDEDEDEMQQEDAEQSDDLALAEGSDNEDLIDLDEEVPGGLVDYDGSDTENAPNEQEWTGLNGGQKRKRGDEKRAQGKRKKLRSLPTFASYEDYAKMIDEGPEDDI
jgi:ribosome biogenesis protein MAK21